MEFDRGAQFEPPSTDDNTLARVYTNALGGWIRRLSRQELKELDVPDTFDPRSVHFFAVFFQAKREYPQTRTAFVEEQVAQRMGLPVEDVARRRRDARTILQWANNQLSGTELNNFNIFNFKLKFFKTIVSVNINSIGKIN